MATLTTEQLKDSYQSLVTIGDSITSDPTSGQLENGKGTPLTAVGIGTSPNTDLHIRDSATENPTLIKLEGLNSGRGGTIGTTSQDGANDVALKFNSLFTGGTFGGHVFSVNDTEAMRIDGIGDISFRDTSANEAFYWDASAGSLGIGTSSPSQLVHLSSLSTAYYLAETTGTGTSAGIRIKGDASADYTLFTTQGTNQFAIYDNAAGSERMRIDSSGNVGIGTTSTTGTLLNILNTSTKNEILFRGTDYTNIFSETTNGIQLGITSTGNTAGIEFLTNAQERMRIDSSGNVGIGETSPSAKLEITGTDTEPLTVLNNTVYTFAANVTTSQSNTHTVTIPFTSQASNHSNFIVEIYASLNWASGASTTFAGRALYTLNTLTSVSNVAELEDVNNGNLSFSATSSGMDFVVTITTTAGAGQEPDRIGVMAKVIRGNGSVGNEPISMTIA